MPPNKLAQQLSEAATPVNSNYLMNKSIIIDMIDLPNIPCHDSKCSVLEANFKNEPVKLMLAPSICKIP